MWNPWNWVKSLWNTSFTGVKQLFQWVINEFGLLYDYVNALILWVETAINAAMTYALNLATSIERWVNSIWNNLVGWVKQLGADIVRWTSGLINQLWSYVQEALNFAHWVYSYLTGLIARAINDMYQWVLRNIWDPLYNWVTGIYKYLTQYINYILQFIEHPELLAQLIGTYLLKTWLSLAKRFAVPLARWWMRTMMSLTGEFFDIIESIISQVL